MTQESIALSEGPPTKPRHNSLWSEAAQDLAIAWPALLRPVIFLLCLIYAGNLSPSEVELLGRWPEPESAGYSPLEHRLTASSDAAFYIHLAFDGYHSGDRACAYYPLWPATIRLVHALIGGHSVWPVFVLASLLSSSGYMLLARLIRIVYGTEIARRAILLHAAAPGALFLTTIYSEPLFFLLMAGLFLALECERTAVAWICALLLPLTRPIGVFALGPLVWRALRNPRQYSRWTLCVAPLLGFLSYLGLMTLWTGNPFEGFAAEKLFPAQPSIWKIFDLVAFGKSFLHMGQFHRPLDSDLDRVFFVLFAGTVGATWKLRREWFWWAVLIGVVPATSSSLMSYTRYVAMVFPIFVVWAKWLTGPGKAILFWYVVLLGAAVQIFLMTRFVRFQWAG